MYENVMNIAFLIEKIALTCMIAYPWDIQIWNPSEIKSKWEKLEIKKANLYRLQKTVILFKEK